jgi:hypothetical protein
MLFDRLKSGLASFVRGVFPRMDYLARYPGRVVQQGGANSFDFQPDSPGVPGLSGVPLRLPFPGCTLQVDATQSPRCLLGFANGDPSQPFLELWEVPGLSSLTVDPAASVNLGPASAAVGRVGDAISVTSDPVLGPALSTWLSAVGTAAGAGPFPGGFVISSGSPKVKA